MNYINHKFKYILIHHISQPHILKYYNNSLPNVLIIALIRNSHKYFGDLDFRNNLSLNGFCVQGMFKKNNYYLKACVSLNNKGESFTDIQTSNNI